MKHEDGLPISEIARQSGLSPTQVVGALRGIKGSYDPEYSLLKLHLVKERESRNPGKRRQKIYEFNSKNLVSSIERVMERYRQAGEG